MSAQQSNSQSSRSRGKSSSGHDRYYGYRETAEFCEYVVSTLFPIPRSSSSSSQQQPSSSTTDDYPRRPGVDTPPISPDPNQASSSKTTAVVEPKAAKPLGEFVAYALYRTRLSQPITYIALVLLTRLKALYPSARGTPTSPHRLFLSALMLASKITMDDTYSNKSWAIVGSDLWDVKEVNQMERELFAFLGWNVVVHPEELEEWERLWGAQWQQKRRKRRQEREAREVELREREQERHRRAEAAARALLAQSAAAAANAGAPVPPPTAQAMDADDVEEVEHLAPPSRRSAASDRERDYHSYRSRSSGYRSAGPSSDGDVSSASPETSASSAPSSSPNDYSSSSSMTNPPTANYPLRHSHSTQNTRHSHHSSRSALSTHSEGAQPHAHRERERDNRRPSGSSSRGPDSEYYESDAETDVSASTGGRSRWARPRGRDTPATPITPAEEGFDEAELAAAAAAAAAAPKAYEQEDVEMRPSTAEAASRGKAAHIGGAVRWIGNVVRGWGEQDEGAYNQHQTGYHSSHPMH